MEGPFGDHTGFYSLADLYPQVHVTAITMRRNPIFPATIVGRPPMEDFYLGHATERIFLPLLKLTIPEVVDYHMPAEGIFHNLVFVSIKKEYPGQAYKVMNALWGQGLMSLAKVLVIVDHWVDVRNPQEAWWVALNNIDPERDARFTMGPMDVLDVGRWIVEFFRTAQRVDDSAGGRVTRAQYVAGISHGVAQVFGKAKEIDGRTRRERAGTENPFPPIGRRRL
jgi:4-hydroxy-3-polyprenylbenzoate decarboxylase